MGEVSELSTTAVLLADVVYIQGRYDEAEELTRVAEKLGSQDDLITQMLWRSVRAKILARRGSMPLAEQLAREAAAMCAGTDQLHYNADVFMNLAEVLELDGHADAAKEMVERAVRLYTAKGNIVSAKRALTMGALGKLPIPT
jgi:ATP/maltotriose-dependent transcriptional regulator MalT